MGGGVTASKLPTAAALVGVSIARGVFCKGGLPKFTICVEP
jgi:hypothetical protein